MPITLNGKPLESEPPKVTVVPSKTPAAPAKGEKEKPKEEAKIEEPKADISLEELDEQRRNFVSRQFGLGEPRKKAPKKEDKPKVEAQKEPESEEDGPEDTGKKAAE